LNNGMSRAQTSRSNYRFDYRRNGTLTRAAFNQSSDRSSNPRATPTRKKERAAAGQLCHLFAAPSNLYLPHQRHYLGRRFIAGDAINSAVHFHTDGGDSRPPRVRLVGNPLPVQVYPAVHCERQASRAPADIYSPQSARCSCFNILSLLLTNAKGGAARPADG